MILRYSCRSILELGDYYYKMILVRKDNSNIHVIGMLSWQAYWTETF